MPSAARSRGRCSSTAIVSSSACACPEDLIDAMLERSGELRDVEIVAMVATGKSAPVEMDFETIETLMPTIIRTDEVDEFTHAVAGLEIDFTRTDFAGSPTFT